MSTDHDHVSDLAWDRYLAGELTGDAKAVALADADACDVCAARLADLTAQRDAFVVRPLRPATRRRQWLAAPAVAAIAMAVVVVVVLRKPQEPSVRVKGAGVQLDVAAGPPDALVLVATGDRVHAGDVVQAGYSSTRDGFGAVLARDGSGRANVYVPAGSDTMAPLPMGSDRSFPASTILDAITGEEVMIVLWCEARHGLSALTAELQARGDVTTPTGCIARRIVLAKEPR